MQNWLAVGNGGAHARWVNPGAGKTMLAECAATIMPALGFGGGA